jgi:hypothetical protein
MWERGGLGRGLDGERRAANLPAAYNKKGVSDNFFFFGGLQEGAGGWFAPGRLGVEGQRGARSASPSHWREAVGGRRQGMVEQVGRERGRPNSPGHQLARNVVVVVVVVVVFWRGPVCFCRGGWRNREEGVPNRQTSDGRDKYGAGVPVVGPK